MVEFHELGEIELGLLEELDLPDEDVLEGEDLLALLHDRLTYRILNTILYNIIYRPKNKENRAFKARKRGIYYNFLVSSLRVDFWASLIIISIIFLRMSLR